MVRPARRQRRIPIGRVITAVLVAAILLFGLFRMILLQTVARHLDAVAGRIPGCRGIRYAQLVVPYTALRCTVQDVTLLFDEPRDVITVRSFQIRDFRPGEVLPRRLDALACGVTINADHPLTARLGAYLLSLGYATLNGDLALHWARRGASTESWFIDLALGIANAGLATVSLQAERVNPQGVAAALENPVNWFLVLPPVELAAAAWRFEDHGLLARALAAEARGRQIRPETLRNALGREWHRRSQSATQPAERAFWQAMADLAHGAGCIALQTRLSQPLPVGQLLWRRTPGDVIQRLALESRADATASCPTGRLAQTLGDQCQSTPASLR